MGTKVFVIPQFQRHYKWKQAQWLRLFEDLLDQYHSEAATSGNIVANEGHFLGSVVLHPAPGPHSTVSRYLVIDGQQRLTTLMVLIAAARDVRAEIDESWDPKAYDDQYLGNPYSQDDPHRLVLGDNDRSDFESTVYHASPSGQVGNAYRWFVRALRTEIGTNPDDHRRLEVALLLRMLVVEINTSIDDNIQQIFHTINHAGLKLTAIDLIRNHSFMQFSPAVASRVYEETWRPMEAALSTETTFAKYLWAQLVRANPKATQRDLYGPFVQLTGSMAKTAEDPAQAVEQLLARLWNEIALFQLIEDPWNTPYSIPAGLRQVLEELATWGSQTYIPLALEVLSQAESGRCSERDAETCLRSVLSYLVRRGLSGIPTNNLNRILSAIPKSLASSNEIRATLENELTVASRYWPTDAELIERGRTSAIALTLQPHQVEYILESIEDSMHNENFEPLSDAQTVYLMPKSLSDDWLSALAEWGVSEDSALTRLHVLGNLSLSVSDPSLDEMDFRAKFERLASQGFGVNDSLPRYRDWTPESIDARSVELLTRAVQIWRRPDGKQRVADVSSELLPRTFDVAAILDSIPGDSVAFLETVSDLTAITPDEVVVRATELGYPIVEMVFGDRIAPAIVGLAGGVDGADSSNFRVLDASEIVRAVQLVGAEVELSDLEQSVGEP